VRLVLQAVLLDLNDLSSQVMHTPLLSYSLDVHTAGLLHWIDETNGSLLPHPTSLLLSLYQIRQTSRLPLFRPPAYVHFVPHRGLSANLPPAKGAGERAFRGRERGASVRARAHTAPQTNARQRSSL